MLVKMGKDYEREVKGIVPDGSLWGAIRYSGDIEPITVDNIEGYALSDGRVFVLKDVDWNDMMVMAKFDVDGFQLPEPKFKTVDEPIALKMGMFSEVYRKGYIVFPLEGSHDFENKPIVIRKG